MQFKVLIKIFSFNYVNTILKLKTQCKFMDYVCNKRSFSRNNYQPYWNC